MAITVKYITNPYCENCDDEIEFDAEDSPNDWENVNCPNCGTENTLYFDHAYDFETAMS